MWDFSWLYAGHPGGAYEDLERRVAEAVERGYNTLRVDCFPSRVLEPESRFEKNWSREADLPFWGQRAVAFSCNVRRKVAELANLCRNHGLWLGLDCWDVPHMLGHSRVIAPVDEEREFTRYGEIWAKALRLLREDGVLERAVWVAPMNEVPNYCGKRLGSLAPAAESGKTPEESALTRCQKTDAVYRRVNEWMAAPIKPELDREKIPLSYSSSGVENYGARLTDVYDVVDLHFMPGVLLDADDKAAFEKAGKGAPGGRFAQLRKYNLKAFSDAWGQACRRHYSEMLERVRDYHEAALQHLTLPSGKKLAAIITESFGPCYWPDVPVVSWDWYKRYNGDALRLVAAMDIRGSSLSNYAEPLFTLWNEAEWHWASNTYLLAAATWK